MYHFFVYFCLIFKLPQDYICRESEKNNILVPVSIFGFACNTVQNVIVVNDYVSVLESPQ